MTQAEGSPQEGELESATPEEIEAKIDSSIDELKRELAEMKDKYFRALAESENARKRLQKEKLESQAFAVQNVICDFLQPMDHLETALKHADNAAGEVKNWAIGFKMILNQFKQVLEDNDVIGFSSVNEAFDPHLHEAIETIETEDLPQGTVVEECLRGYKMGAKVIRPAKVKVAIAPGANSQNNEKGCGSDSCGCGK